MLSSSSQQCFYRLFEVFLDAIQETLGEPAVDCPMIKGQGYFEHRANFHRAIDSDRFLDSAGD